jgi:hypothetical protein
MAAQWVSEQRHPDIPHVFACSGAESHDGAFHEQIVTMEHEGGARDAPHPEDGNARTSHSVAHY